MKVGEKRAQELKSTELRSLLDRFNMMMKSLISLSDHFNMMMKSLISLSDHSNMPMKNLKGLMKLLYMISRRRKARWNRRDF